MLLLRLLLLLGVGGLAGSPLSAQTNPPALTPPHDVTAAVINGINFFRQQAATNDEGWLCHPIPGQRVSGYQTRTYHYKQVAVTYPGYKSEPYEVLVPGATPGDPMHHETRYRPTTRDPSQDHVLTQEVYDVNGPIIREVQVPIYEKDAGCRWRYGGLGNNGLAILALRRCGIEGTDPLVATPAQRLAEVIQTFGMPDALRDLAGLTAGFAVMPGDHFKQLTEHCAAKLLDAQLISGPGTGLWGPVAINPSMVSAFTKTLMRLGDEKKAVQAEVVLEQRKKPTGKPTAKANRLEADIARIDARVADLQLEANRITQLGFKMFDALGLTVHYGRISLGYQTQLLNIEALPYVVQNQISADLESTALALFALRVAFENGRLPMKTWRPDPPKSASPGTAPDFPAPREAREVLALAIKAITAARTKDGLWPEVNLHQSVTNFAWLKSVPQIKPELFPKLRQPVTLASTVNGAAALANIQMLQTGAAGPTALENPVCRPLVQDLLLGKPLAGSNEVQRAPFDVLLQITALHNTRGKSLRRDFALWNEVADWLVGNLNPTGGWGRANKYVFMPGTSLAALRAVLPPIEPKDMGGLYDKPHLSTGFSRRADQYDYCNGEYEGPYFTLAALLFLADGLPEGWTPAPIN